MPWQWPFRRGGKKEPLTLDPGRSAAWDLTGDELTLIVRVPPGDGIVGAALLYHDDRNKLGLRFLSLYEENPLHRIINAVVTIAKDMPVDSGQRPGGVM
jgi:hypothetical protein